MKPRPTRFTPGALSSTPTTTCRILSPGHTPTRTPPAYLLVKGATDYLADSRGVIATVAEPRIEALEAIGGTGDTLTGISGGVGGRRVIRTFLPLPSGGPHQPRGRATGPTHPGEIYPVLGINKPLPRRWKWSSRNMQEKCPVEG